MYAQLTLDVTPEAVAKMAHKLGVRSRLDVDGAYVPSIGLGAMDVSPLDMASAYATLAAGGIYSEPMAIRKVVLPDGEDTNAGWGKPKRKRVISDGVADTVTRILEENIRYGTGAAAYYGQPAAGKTGTTEEWSDAWFCGYTPRLGTTVWVGYPKGKISMTSVHGIPVTGGSFPAQIWRLFMSSAIGQLEPVDFPEPKHEPEWKDFERGQYAALVRLLPGSETTSRRDHDRGDDDDELEETPPAAPPDAAAGEEGHDAARSARVEPAAGRSASAPVDDRPPPRPSSRADRSRCRAGSRSSRPVRSRFSSRGASPLPGSSGLRSSRPTRAAPTAAGSALCSSCCSLAAFACYLGGLLLLRRRAPALRATLVAAFVIQLLPLAGAAAALDRRLGVLGVRPDRGRPRRQSLRGHAERVPGRPRLRRRRRRLA